MGNDLTAREVEGGGGRGRRKGEEEGGTLLFIQDIMTLGII